MIEFNHFNFNVLDLEKVLLFIRKQSVFPLSAKKIPVMAVSKSSISATVEQASIWNLHG